MMINNIIQISALEESLLIKFSHKTYQITKGYLIHENVRDYLIFERRFYLTTMIDVERNLSKSVKICSKYGNLCKLVGTFSPPAKLSNRYNDYYISLLMLQNV